MILHYCIKSFDELTTKELYAIVQLRIEIFVVEQNCPFQDLDGQDFEALHIFSINQNQCNAYARIRPTDAKEVLISRVMISQETRGFGLAYELMALSIKQAKKNFPKNQIKIAAQKRLQSFYEKCGFVYNGKDFYEDGIPHCTMYYIDQ